MSAPAPADIDLRLYTEFHDRYSLHQIETAIADAQHDLTGTPPGALPELIERLTPATTHRPTWLAVRATWSGSSPDSVTRRAVLRQVLGTL
jgi:hypothetical protein